VEVEINAMQLIAKLRLYWPLIKSLQTGLLLSTGLAGYMSAHSTAGLNVLFTLVASLFLSISGSTILNMWYDCDIDTVMNRTHNRPMSSGKVSKHEALWLGLVLSLIGVGWAVAMDALYGLVVFTGLFFDVVVYTSWLKRRTCWSIAWGGIAGGMPILAGRVLAVGHIDIAGLAMAVLFWILPHLDVLNALLLRLSNGQSANLSLYLWF
jgi:protoheme IX farnesyltransferase